MLTELAKSKGLESDKRINLQNLGNEIIQESGYNGIAQLLLDTYHIRLKTHCIIEGIRHIDVCSYYKDLFGNNFYQLYVDCPIEQRYVRLLNNPTKRSSVTSYEDFVKMGLHPVETQIQEIKRIANKILDNSQSIENLHGQIDNLNFTEYL